ncbi:hypothetical protein B0O80DRAFT_503346 [Mortierella sp. GBAus27b]|nr:hypothetical protein BGX31_007456 [Mortierella sp. GBA43]KAI8346566.1 hypothetical protein B0O80DRAFT_503346 [Mortierella sp. GBAus27b]
MSANVSEGESSYRHIPIADSGAKIPQHIKEVDRNQKVKLFECLQALIKGRLPTNEQLDHFLSMAQSSPSLEARAHMLSADGRALYRDFQELLRVAREIIFEKNEQELFQNFVYHCSQASDTVAQDVSAPDMNMGVSSRKAKKEGRQTLDSLITVAKLVTTNSEFRSILSELFQVASQVFSEGADKVAKNAQSMGDRISSTANDLSQNATDTTQSNNARLQQNIYRATDRVQDLAEQSKEDPILAAQATRDDIVEQTDNAMDAARRQAGNLRQTWVPSGQNFKSNAQAKAKALQQDAAQYANEKMPPEKRHALVERLKTLVAQIQSNPQYQTALDSIMDLLGIWRERAKKPVSNVSREASKAVADQNVESAIVEFKVILQRWAQGYSLDPLIDVIHNIWQKTVVDQELNQYFNEISGFMMRVLREPDYATSQAINDDASLLIDQGQTLATDKYKDDVDALVYEGKTFLENLTNDPKSKEVAAMFQKFARDLLYDKRGNLKFKPHLFDDFRYVLLPSMMESFQFIPVPRIEYSDLKVDFMFDNMILTSTDLLPRLFEINMNNTIRMVPRGNANNHSLDYNRHDFNMFVQGIEASIREVDYYVKTKEGLRFQDRGIADVLVSGKGLDIRVKGKMTPDDEEEANPPSLVTYEDVKVTIHSLSIKMRQSNHPILYMFAQPFIKTIVKNAIAHALESQIKEALVTFDRTLATSIRDSRIRTGKNTFGALVDTATSFVSNKVSPDDKTKARNERKMNSGHYNRTSRVIFDEDGLCVLDPVKHMELKVGQPLREDPNEMANMPAAPWVSSAFDMDEMAHREHAHLPGMRRTQGTVAM